MCVVFAKKKYSPTVVNLCEVVCDRNSYRECAHQKLSVYQQITSFSMSDRVFLAVRYEESQEEKPDIHAKSFKEIGKNWGRKVCLPCSGKHAELAGKSVSL